MVTLTLKCYITFSFSIVGFLPYELVLLLHNTTKTGLLHYTSKITCPGTHFLYSYNVHVLKLWFG